MRLRSSTSLYSQPGTPPEGVEHGHSESLSGDTQDFNLFPLRNVSRLPSEDVEKVDFKPGLNTAENKLTVTLHGCLKPTGLERTFPNLLSEEGVMNLEYDKWDRIGITADHEVTVPFTRMLAGPLDFHQGSFRTVKREAFKPHNEAPLVMGTPARTLASYVVYQNHLSMVADYPTAYRGHPGLPMLAAIPTTWDDTKVLDAEVGEYIVIARRSRATWYVGAMTNEKERTFDVPLRFLSTGSFSAEIASDEDSAKHGLSISKKTVTPRDTIKLKLSSGGGSMVRIVPK